MEKRIRSSLKQRLKIQRFTKKSFRNYISRIIKSNKQKTDLINHRISLLNNGAKVDRSRFPAQENRLIKSALESLSTQLFYLGENHLISKRRKAGILKLQEAQSFAEPELRRRIMTKLAIAFLKNKMPQESGSY